MLNGLTATIDEQLSNIISVEEKKKQIIQHSFIHLKLKSRRSNWYNLGQGVGLTFTRDHISFAVAFKGPNVTLGLYKCNYSLMSVKELSAASG